MERVTQVDLPEVTEFLRGNVDCAMFPLSNLAEFGLDGDHAYAPQMWMNRNGGEVTGVLCVTRNRTVLPVCPAEAAADVLRGSRVFRIMGPAELCRPLISALGLDGAGALVDREDPHYALGLSDLRVPEGPGQLRSLGDADRDEMIDWSTAYHAEVLGSPLGAAAKDGRRAYDSMLARDSHRVLMDDGRPLAMTGFNAALPDIVQIGGVYTPPGLRGQGHARRALALHLAEARARGVQRSILFAANPSAQRAYEAIGFRRIGDMTLFLLKEPVDV